MSANRESQPHHEAIARRAYELWTQAGQPAGGGERHWLQAEAELKLGTSTKSILPAVRRAKRTAMSL